ncbi:hypothethical protein (plasmid) [Ralstonia solanacearum PSI07]|nr:hypothethical protein [Ralstonia solanacearum PSI07]
MRQLKEHVAQRGTGIVVANSFPTYPVTKAAKQPCPPMVMVELKLNSESFFFPEQHTHFPGSFRTTFGTFEFRNYPPPSRPWFSLFSPFPPLLAPRPYLRKQTRTKSIFLSISHPHYSNHQDIDAHTAHTPYLHTQNTPR